VREVLGRDQDMIELDLRHPYRRAIVVRQDCAAAAAPAPTASSDAWKSVLSILPW
jgi:hypothetical protein